MSGTTPAPRSLPPPARRWAVSFADLALLIACTLMLGWRPAATAAGGTGAAPVVLVTLPVATLFVPGEAMLRADAEAQLAPARRVLAAGGQISIRVGSGGRQRGSRRLDAWELAAARTAVLARHLGAARVTLGAPDEGARVRIAATP